MAVLVGREVRRDQAVEVAAGTADHRRSASRLLLGSELVRRVSGGAVRPGRLVAAPPVPPRAVACRRVATERRVLVLLVGALLVAGVVVGLAMLSGASGGGSDVPSGTTVVQVQPGESLWELAERVAPGGSPDDVVERIRQLNGLRGAVVHPGEPLVVPDGGVGRAGAADR